MGDIRSTRCSHFSCTKNPSFNVKGAKTAICRTQHAAVDMVDVRSKRCFHHSCMKYPSVEKCGGQDSSVLLATCGGRRDGRPQQELLA